MKIEIDMLRTQINNEKAVIQSLEGLIASLREQEFQMQVQMQNKESDFNLVKDRANTSELKMYDFKLHDFQSTKILLNTI